jgi:hypothetical protein
MGVLKENGWSTQNVNEVSPRHFQIKINISREKNAFPILNFGNAFPIFLNALMPTASASRSFSSSKSSLTKPYMPSC